MIAAVVLSFCLGVAFGSIVVYVAGVYASSWAFIIAGGVIWVGIVLAVCLANSPPAEEEAPLIAPKV